MRERKGEWGWKTGMWVKKARGEGRVGELSDTGGVGARRGAPVATTAAAAAGAACPSADPRRRRGRAAATRPAGGARGGRAQRRAEKSSTQGKGGGGVVGRPAGRELRGTQGPPLLHRGGPPADVTGTGWAACGGGAPAGDRSHEPPVPSGPPPVAHLSKPSHEPHARKEGRHSLPAKADLGGGGGSGLAPWPAQPLGRAPAREGPRPTFSNADRVSRLCVLAGGKAGARS